MEREKQRKLIVYVLTTAAVYLAFKYLLPLFLPFVAAYVIAYILTPPVRFLYGKVKLPLCVSCFVGITGLLGIFSFVFWKIGKALWRQGMRLLNNLPGYEERIIKSLGGMCERADGILGRDAGTVKEMIMEEDGLFDSACRKAMESAAGVTIDIAEIIAVVTGVTLIILVSAILILYDRIRKKSIGEIVAENETRSVRLVKKGISEAGAAYLKTQLILMGITSAVCSMGLAIMGNAYALLIGVGIGFMDALPVLGSGLVFVPWVLISFFNGRVRDGFILLITYGVCQLVREFLEPKLLGDKIGVKPVYTVMAMYVGLKLFGFFGFILGPVGLIIIKYAAAEFSENEKTTS